MRILAGALKGRVIGRPKSAGVRPMSGKVRAALFNIVGSVEGLTILDAYAGSGAVGFEALSRGAASAVAIEASRIVASTIRKSAEGLNIANYELYNGRLEDWLKRATAKLDLIVADPPYDLIDNAVLGQLAGHLTEKGTFVVSHSSRIGSPELKSLKLVDSRKYGDSTLSFYNL